MSSYDFRSASRPIRIDKLAIRRLVDGELIPELTAWLKRQDQEEPIGAKRGIAGTTLVVSPVGGRPPLKVAITVRSVRSPSDELAVVSGQAALLPWDWQDDEQRVEVALNLNARLTPVEYLNERMSANASDRKYVPYGLYSVLIHELTHVMEMPFMRGPAYEQEDERPSNVKEYVNSPIEVRAFMQQIVDEVLVWAKRAVSRTGKTNRSLIDQVLRRSTTWQRVHHHMNAANRKKLLSAVYDALDTAGLLFDA